MRVAMLSFHTCPLAVLGGKDTGGMNVYVRELTRHLGREGVHVDVFTRSQDEHVPQVLHDLGYGNRVVHIPAGPENPMSKRELAVHIPEFVAGVVDFARQKGENYDLVHAHYWMSGVAAIALREAWGAPTVLMTHTLALLKNRIARGEEEREGAYRIDGETKAIRAADHLVAATEAEQRALVDLYGADPARISIIPPGVDVSHFYPIALDESRAIVGLPMSERVILFVGRIEPLKGLDTLLQAIALLREAGMQCVVPHYLVIIGGDPSASGENLNQEMVRLQKLSHELGLDELVLFLGKRGQEHLPYYYSAADILVMPSHYESFGLVALEAMACGTPVVASQVGGLAHLVLDGQTGFVIPNGDPDLLSKRIAVLLTDDALREKLGRQAAEYARQYSWVNIANRMIGLYQGMLTGVPSTRTPLRLVSER